MALSLSGLFEIDLSRIEDHILKPNYLLMLGFPTGWVPLRVLYSDPLQFYVYDPIAEGAMSGPVPAASSTNGITNLGWQPPIRFSSIYISGQPQNVLRVENVDELYQIFLGISPPMLRVYRQIPPGTSIATIDEASGGWTPSYSQFGWIDGRESPFHAPSPRSEIIIPPRLDVAFAMANPTPEPMHPLFNIVLNRVKVGVVADVDLVDKMLSRRVYVEYYNVGGLEMPATAYSVENIYNIKPITLDMTKDEIARALAGAAAGR